jgi:hypothetical protein
VPKSVQAWPAVDDFCNKMERLHHTIDDHFWPCECSDDHADVWFSFDVPCRTREGLTDCSLVYRRALGLQQATLHFDAENTARRHAKTRRNSGSFDEKERTLCDALGSLKEGQSVKIFSGPLKVEVVDEKPLALSPSRSITVSRRPSPELSVPSNLEMLSLQEWLEKTQLGNVWQKQRLTLALILSYAYLHLSGGPWWSYTWNKVSVHLLSTSTSSQDVLRPYFCYTSASEQCIAQ